VLPPDVKVRVAVEAAHPMGWDRYVGEGGLVIGIDRFGASAPGGRVMKEYGFTAENVADHVMRLLG
jgi:transketolase